jgi:hypothetical protein
VNNQNCYSHGSARCSRPRAGRDHGVSVGYSLARVELVDEQQIVICNAHSKLTLPERPTLFLEFRGSESSVREQSESGEIVAEYGGSAFEWSAKPRTGPACGRPATTLQCDCGTEAAAGQESWRLQDCLRVC